MSATTALPGDPEAIAYAARMALVDADNAGRIGETLASIILEGRATSLDPLRVRLHSTVAKLAETHSRYMTTARALDDFAVHLRALQDRQEIAEQSHSTAVLALSRAQSRGRTFAFYADQAEAEGAPVGSVAAMRADAQHETDEGAHHSFRAEAAMADLRAIRSEWDDLGQRIALALREATPQQPTYLLAMIAKFLARNLGAVASLPGWHSGGKHAPGPGEYVVGPATRPEIEWDEDFVYDSKGSTWTDHLNKVKWQTKAEGAAVVRQDLDDALAAYWHYWDNNGKHFTFDYEEAYREDHRVKLTVDAEIGRAQAGAESLINSGRTSFSMTGGANNADFYPETENWQKAIGGHKVWSSAEVTVKGNTATMTVVVHGEDYYNFNRGQSDIASGAQDDENGRFTEIGWAKPFEQSGTVTKTMTWELGEAGNATVDSEGSGSRQRTGDSRGGRGEDRADRG